jgi:hypothetical protein
MLVFFPVYAQMQSLAEFEDVNIPFDLKYKDLIIKGGKYNLEFFKHGVNQVFYLKIKKGNKTICLIPEGERVKYKGQGNINLLMDNPDIPSDSRLSIKRNPALKIAYIIFETGKRANVYPFYKLRFKVEYEVSKMSNQ